MSYIDINVETLLLVSIWDQTCVFQGCFKIVTLDSHPSKEQYYIFRCEVSHATKMDFMNNEFSPDDYIVTHLYRQTQKICPDQEDDSHEFALYILKYALYITLVEMLMNSPHKQHSLSMDDSFLDSLLDNIKPIINKEPLWSEPFKEIGFAVAMDFCPKEEMGKAAAMTLLNGFIHEDENIH